MADTNLQDRILKIFEGKPKKSESAAKLVQILKISKKAVNHQLYMMEKKGQIVKIKDSPPAWSLRNPENVLSLSDLQGGVSSVSWRRRSKWVQTQGGDDADIEAKILRFIKGSGKSCKALEIAKSIGLGRAADVNASLYKLQDDGLIAKNPSKVPTWCLKNKQATDAQSSDTETDHANAGCHFYSTSIDGSQLLQVKPELLRTDLSLEPYLSDISTVAACEDHFGVKPTVGEHNGGACDQFSYIKLCGQMCHDDDSDDDSDNSNDDANDDTERNVEQMEVDSGEGLGNAPIALVTKSEHVETVESIAMKSVKSGVDRLHSGDYKRGVHRTASEHDLGRKKPKTFRDVFGLDDPMEEWSNESVQSLISKDDASISDQCNNDSELHDIEIETDSYKSEQSTVCAHSVSEKSLINQDSRSVSGHVYKENMLDSSGIPELSPFVNLGNIVNESTPEIPILKPIIRTPETQKNSVSEKWATPDVFHFVLDHEKKEYDNQVEENKEAGADNIIDFVSTFSNNRDLKSHDSAENANIDNQKTEIAESRQTDSGMKKCITVLQVLNSGLGLAQFVLKKKTDLEEKQLETLLEKCLRQNYVSGSSRLWKITPEGQNYLSEAGVCNGKDQRMSANNTIEPAKKMRSIFSGPPPSPKALLNAQSMNKPSDSHKIMPHSSDNVPVSTVQSSCSGSLNSSVSTVLFKQEIPSLMSLTFSQSKNDRNVALSTLASGSLSGLPLGNKTSGQFGAVSTPAFTQRQLQSSDVFDANSVMPCLNSNLWSYSNLSTNSSFQSGSGSIKPASRLMSKDPAVSLRPTPSPNLKPLPNSQAVQKMEIPDKYADYPNKSTAEECFKQKKSFIPSSCNKVSRAPPPSPMDIISKTLNRTEISPPRTTDSSNIVSKQNSVFANNTQTSTALRNAESYNQSSTMYLGKQQSLFGQTKSLGLQSTFASQSASRSMLQTGHMGRGALTLTQNLPMPSRPLSACSSLKVSSVGPPPSPAFILAQERGQSCSIDPIQLSGVAIPAFSQPHHRALTYQMPLTTAVSTARPVMTPANKDLSLALSSESFAALNKNPVSALMEYAQSRKQTARVEVISRRGASHRPTFEMAAFVGDRKFPAVTCTNKKDGRQEACDVALRKLVAEGQFYTQANNSGCVDTTVPMKNLTHFDKMAALTHRGFTALVSQITCEAFAGRKVVAGLVMKRSEEDTGVLISLGTGNRCITGQQLSLHGNTVNDSHAEIITRRGFLRQNPP
ncbi:uncharacterized protein LOC128230583 isoform X2 [Mya arenaria]|uniref:uncharacterized protein LOC128230583 isoform X2 n=1 Tax=Mya arenaria TaxID=6604 RepID=UPI0022E3D4FA|nr:uncharacterized protein LOC128230583 isoform X2 [Mya arenaria]